MEFVPIGSTVLDIGCGGGLFLGLLAASGQIRNGFGIDTSDSAIQQAKAMAAEFSGDASLSFDKLDADAPFPGGNFDVISLNDVMHHIPRRDQRTFFARVADKIQPGGKLVYKDVANRPFWSVFTNQIHDLILARQWVHVVPGDTICVWADHVGLRMVERKTVITAWYSHELFLFEREQ